MTTITLKLPRPHEAQRQILDSPARYKVINCGRRFGKTELFCHVLLNGHAPGTYGALAGYPVAYVSLTYKNVKELWNRLIAMIPASLIAYKNESAQLLKLVTGGSIECWTFERFVLARGRAYMGIGLDEAAQTRNLKEAWQEVFVAMLVDYAGWAVIGSSPQGFNYFYDLFQMGRNPQQSAWGAWQFSSYDNPFIAPSEIDQIKAMLPEIVFQREYMADFRVSEGLVYPDFSLAGNVTTDAEYHPDWPVLWGVDDGYAHGEGPGTPGYHPRVILEAQLRPDGGINVFDEYVATLQLPEKTLGEVLSRPYPLPDLAMVDSSAAEFRRRLFERGIRSAPGSHKVSDGIKVVRRFVCDGNGVRLLKIHPRCKVLIQEFQSYHYSASTQAVDAGEPKPEKLDDHCMDALRYLLFNYR